MAARLLKALTFAVTFHFLLSFIALAINTHSGSTHEMEEIPKRHDYKLTFKKPYYYNGSVPFFDTYGSRLLGISLTDTQLS